MVWKSRKAKIGYSTSPTTTSRSPLHKTQSTDRQYAFAQAVAGVRQAGKVQYLPHFLLHRAQFHHDQHNPTDAWRDLTEAEEIIQNCDMALYAVDAHLLRGHLLLTSNPPDNDTGLTDLIACIDAAEQGIQTTGYHLRDAELHLLKAAAYPDQKDHYLDLAQQRIEEIGQFGLLGRLEKMRDWFPSLREGIEGRGKTVIFL